MPDDPKLIAIAYDLNFRHAAEIFSGASEYIAREGLNWRLLALNFGFEAKLMDLAASGRLSGAIGTFVSDPWIGGLRAHRVAVVNLFNFSRIETAPTISLDDEAVGRAAAAHLLEQGAGSLAFISQDEAYFNQVRRESFARSCPADRFHGIHTMEPRRPQAERLRNLERPVGVLCSNDRIAQELCNEARLLGMEIGRDLLVIGIGNDPAESTFAGIGLSSFDIPAREIGERAVRQMETALRPAGGKQAGSLSEKIPAKLVCRESTLSSRSARLVERAVAAIHESIARADFDIASLCRTLGVSRRSLELSTRRQMNKSPYQILSEHRLAKAKHRLRTSNEAIGKIGEECGLPEPHHFSAWFKQRMQMPPKKYRSTQRSEMTRNKVLNPELPPGPRKART